MHTAARLGVRARTGVLVRARQRFCWVFWKEISCLSLLRCAFQAAPHGSDVSKQVSGPVMIAALRLGDFVLV